MTNIEIKQDGDKLTLEIDLSKPGKLSSSGKSYVIASSHGYQAVDDTFKLNLNVIRKS